MYNVGKGDRNREDMGISRKFAKGTVHENATGKFTIMDRFKEENIIYLEFQWLSGEKAGQVEINKEGNMNASIHKFNASRGITPAIQYTEKVEPFVEKIDLILELVQRYEPAIEMSHKNNELLKENNSFIDKFDQSLNKLAIIITEQQRTIEELSNTVHRVLDRSDTIEKQAELLSKLVDKLG